MIAMRMISSTPKYKTFIIPVDLVLQFFLPSIKNCSEGIMTKYCHFHQKYNSFSVLLCAQWGEESLAILRENRSTSQSLHLWIIKVTAVQDIPNSHSKLPSISHSFKETSRVERLLQISLANSQPGTCIPGTLKAAGILLLTRRYQGFCQ